MDATEKLKQLTLLYVEDEDIARLSIGSFLRRYMGELLLASNGSEGLQLYQEKRPAVVITDLEMPVMNGYEVCERLKSGEKTSAIPIILLTGERLEPKSILDRCLNLGVESFLLKPLKLEDLLSKIKETLGEK